MTKKTKVIRVLALGAILALSLVASGADAFVANVDAGDHSALVARGGGRICPAGVTWEAGKCIGPFGATWE